MIDEEEEEEDDDDRRPSLSLLSLHHNAQCCAVWVEYLTMRKQGKTSRETRLMNRAPNTLPSNAERAQHRAAK